MSSKVKKIVIPISIIILLFVGKYVYDMNINHNFETITEGKVYKSGVIPPDEIESYVKKYNIKSIVDLRFPGTTDLVNNPEIPTELTAEKEAIAKIKGVNYFNNGSDQVPTPENVKTFLKIMDNKSNYPVLIHCYHGIGRAELYSAIYRIEYENFTNKDARNGVRTLVKFSSFDDGKPKGEYLMHYKPRKDSLK
ncbi:dual specificity protein phosphatase family protein [Flavobacterium psychrophilum]|uniref:Tyrosine specific protein phosphatases domain-containing protein n=3 Tax=Flavobacterium psychrophilum TaxID=96345 RepID=A6GY09_FLAPJ|nr:dual specificity protein phosphatase family protein [Flavobacterium psychrophilum]AIG29707.1 protein phosphatase [Flavobacterium psychrophilum]AIG31984.1 protein phosphatase [Flavobacterium psychrophilum]AIG34139.1 protein phosphatase [Flavobacterium psychrophilum]AIG36502.1 protein phosphatase [Flavobacterium psychrophilum]AIG38767.1 protein phosphatase [Flavobacterium psychrophilum]